MGYTYSQRMPSNHAVLDCTERWDEINMYKSKGSNKTSGVSGLSSLLRMLLFPSPAETTGCMAALVARAADSLGIHPPPNGGVDIKKLTVVPTLSPRQSVQEFDLTGSSRTPSSSFSSPVHHSSEGGLPSPDSDFTAER